MTFAASRTIDTNRLDAPCRVVSPQAQTAVTEPVPGGPVRRVVVPVGGTDREFLAQEQAVWFAEALDVPVVGVHVAALDEDGRDDLFTYIHQQCTRRNVRFEGLTLQGTDPAATVLDELDALDLAVVGSERLGGKNHLNSFAERSWQFAMFGAWPVDRARFRKLWKR